ncbi:transglutaminase family protein [Nakamurella silvestris]|nr:transglutaminase family protein [Nakamurella silvestris]
MNRSVACRLEAEVFATTRVVLQVAVAALPGAAVAEELSVKVNGKPLARTEVIGVTGTRLHVVQAPPGDLVVTYQADVEGRQAPAPVDELDLHTYLWPSRYAESDRIAGFARTEFAGIDDPADLLAAVSSWVGTRLDYVPGSSDPIDGAIDTLLAGRGVCRDYAHLVVALLRSLQVPARLVAVYAPGIDPMDFHAVAEACLDGVWYVVDATLLGPRASLLRIATGRDAADTAFMTNYGGGLVLRRTEIQATVAGDLPTDNVVDLVTLG